MGSYEGDYIVWFTLQNIFDTPNVHIHHVTRAEKKKACREERGLIACEQWLVIGPFPGFKVVFWVLAIFYRLKKVNTRSMFLF